MGRIIDKLPIYLLAAIMLFTFGLHLYFLIDHPGNNFVEPSSEELERQVEEGEISERTKELREHTWKYGGRDAYLYVKMANQLIEDGIYGFESLPEMAGESNAFVTPGHPLTLVVVISIANLVNVDQMTIITLFNMVLSIATVFLIYLITAKAFKNRWMGIIASGLYATYFPPYHFFRTALTEIPGIFAFCLAIYLFLVAFESNKKLFHFLFAVVFCYGAMIRPVIAPLVLIAFPIIIYKYRHSYKDWMTIFGIWAGGAALIVMPWVIRNYIQFQEIILFSTHSGNSWYAGSNPFGLYDFSDYYTEMYELGMDSKEYAQMKIREGFDQNFPLWLSWFTIGKTYELFKLPAAIYHYGGHWVLGHLKTSHTYLVNLALATGFASYFIRKKEAIAFATVMFGYIALSNLFLTIPRYGFFIIPVMCVLNGYAIVTIFHKIRQLITWIRTKYHNR